VSSLPSVSSAWFECKPEPVSGSGHRDPTEMLPAEDVVPEGRHGSLAVDSEGRGLRLASGLASGRNERLKREALLPCWRARRSEGDLRGHGHGEMVLYDRCIAERPSFTKRIDLDAKRPWLCAAVSTHSRSRRGLSSSLRLEPSTRIAAAVISSTPLPRFTAGARRLE